MRRPSGLRRRVASDCGENTGASIRCNRSFRWFGCRSAWAAPISPDMTAARFDLSRLEGCTGTISESSVAVPHALRPSSDRRERERGRGSRRDEHAAPSAPGEGAELAAPSAIDATVAGTADAQASAAAPGTVPPDATMARIESTTGAAQHATASNTAAWNAGASTALQPTAVTVAAATQTREDIDELPLGVILALTLAAWIPVLLLWSSRLP